MYYIHGCSFTIPDSTCSVSSKVVLTTNTVIRLHSSCPSMKAMHREWRERERERESRASFAEKALHLPLRMTFRKRPYNLQVHGKLGLLSNAECERVLEPNALECPEDTRSVSWAKIFCLVGNELKVLLERYSLELSYLYFIPYTSDNAVKQDWYMEKKILAKSSGQ